MVAQFAPEYLAHLAPEYLAHLQAELMTKPDPLCLAQLLRNRWHKLERIIQVYYYMFVWLFERFKKLVGFFANSRF